MLFDTHAHLFWDAFDSDRDDAVARARDADVRAILNLGTTVETSRQCLQLAERHPECWAAVGFHPNDIGAFEEDPDRGMDALRTMVAHERVVAVGETGLDLYRNRDSLPTQQHSLVRHFDLARQTGLPLVLHNREATRELRAALEEHDEGITAVLHCFTGDEAFGRWAIDRGHYLGLGGVFTFRSSELPGMIGAWDPARLLLETDSPFLSPVPLRGKRNEPSHVVHTARAVAEALEIPFEELADLTTSNACRAFGLPPEALVVPEPEAPAENS
jgi:TatD DNase family protein